MSRRAVIRVALFLLLGAIVNVAVAWLFSAFVSFDGPAQYAWDGVQREAASGRLWQWYVGRNHKCCVDMVFVSAFPDGRTDHEAELFDVLLPSGNRFREHMRQFEVDSTRVDSKYGFINWRASGFPCCALACQWPSWQPSQWPKVPVEDGIHLSPHHADQGFNAYRLRALPLRPIWSGFAINTIFYAAIMWLLFAGPFALRRTIRRRRGLCPACAYPIGVSDVCTECGKAVKVKVDARTMNT